MSDDRVTIPQIPATVETRRVAIESRLRASYPDLDIRVDPAGDVYSIVASCSIGSFTEEVSVHDSTNHTVHRLRDYFRDLAYDYSAYLDRVALATDTPDERGRRVAGARARARVTASAGREDGNQSVTVRLRDLETLLDALDIALDGATAAEEAEHQREIDHSIASHEESLSDEDYRA